MRDAQACVMRTTSPQIPGMEYEPLLSLLASGFASAFHRKSDIGNPVARGESRTCLRTRHTLRPLA